MHEKREEPKESPWTDDEPVRSGDRGHRQRWRARDSGKTAGWRASGHWTQGCSAGAGRRKAGLAFVCGPETLSWILSCLLCRRASEPRRRVGTLPARATRRCITGWPDLDPTAPLFAARRVDSPL